MKNEIHFILFTFQLVSASDPNEPIAYRQAVPIPRLTYGLAIQNEYMEIADYIIATFLIVEVELRKTIGSPII